MNNNQLKEQIGEIASNLIKFRSTRNRKDEILNLFDYVQKVFARKYDIEFKDYDYPALIIKPKNKDPKLYICSHIDVVEGLDNQFEPKIIGSNLYGRGSYDMKTQAAVSLVLLLNTNLNVGVILTSDEEYSLSKNGAAMVAKDLVGKAKLVIVPDGEGTLGLIERVRGMAEYKIISRGVSTRYSYPWRGVNPYPNLMKFYLGLENLFIDCKKASDKNFWYTTYNLLSMDAKDGSAAPEVGTMNILVNFTPEYNRKSLLNVLKEFALKNDCEVEEVFFGSTYEVSKKYLDNFKKEISGILNTECPVITMGGICDVRHFSELGIDTILCTIDGFGAHKDDEFADLDSAILFYKVLEGFISNNFTQ